MNKSYLGRLVHHRLRLRPVARRFNEAGEELPRLDDTWAVAQASPDALVLSNRRTDHIAILRPDAIHHFQEDAEDRRGTLVLNVQVFLQGRVLHTEPLVGAERRVEHLPIRRSATRKVTAPVHQPENSLMSALFVGFLGVVLVAALKGAKP